MSASATPWFLSHVAALRAPRQAAQALCPLAQTLPPTLGATTAGAADCVETGLRGGERQDFPRRFPPCEPGIPSRDTLRDVIAAIDADLFEACFLAWVEGPRADRPDVVATGGKASRRRHGRRRGRLPLHTGSARASRQRLVPGQEGVAAKSNEVTAIPLPPRRPALAGAWVTIEAGGTREETAQALIGGGAGPVLAPKET